MMAPTFSTTPSPDTRGLKRADTEGMKFLEQNKFQRECLQLGSEGYDGFIVVVGLFLVLLVENLWTFDPDSFSEEKLGDAFLILLVAGTACGLFSIFSVTYVKLKVQRLLTRDMYGVELFYMPKSHRQRRKVYLDRIQRRWDDLEPEERPRAPACVTYEWYRGSRGPRKSSWDPRRPRNLVSFAAVSFAGMVTASVCALAVHLADAKGLWWGVWVFVGVGMSIGLPVTFLILSLRPPPGLMEGEPNPFKDLA